MTDTEPSAQTDQTSDTSGKTRSGAGRRWLKRLGIALAVVVVLAVVGKYWAIPAIIESVAASQLDSYWDGDARLDGVAFDYVGRVRMDELALRDRQDRPWGLARGVTVDFSYTQAAPTRVHVTELLLTAHAEDGQFPLPLKLPKTDQPLPDMLELPDVVIERIVLAVADDQGNTAQIPGQATLTREGDAYLINVKLAETPDAPQLALAGTMDGRTRELDVKVTADAQLAPTTTEILARGLPGKIFRNAGGQLLADVRVTGPADQPGKIRADGTAQLDDGVVRAVRGTVAESLNIALTLKGRTATIADGRGTAAVCDGLANFSGEVTFDEQNNPLYSLSLNAGPVSVPKMAQRLGQEYEGTTGLASVQGSVFGQGWSWQGVNGNGTVFLDDTDLGTVPVITQLYDYLKQLDRALTGSTATNDLHAKFEMRGPRIKLITAEIGNPVYAARVQETTPPGWVDLQQQTVDMHVVLIPVRQLNQRLGNLPLVGLLVRLRENLTRVRIQGKWSDPPAELIHKEPLTDLKEGTVAFVKGITQTGGQLGQGVLSIFEENGGPGVSPPPPRPEDDKPTSWLDGWLDD